MTQSHLVRSRRAALAGLSLQLLAFGVTLLLARLAHSNGLEQLAWFLLGGAPIWFSAVLLIRQQELTALEKLDLEHLRREKAATGGGEAIFGDDGAGGLGALAAQARLVWMERWFVPVAGLITALYLVGAGVWRLRAISAVAERGLWPELANLPGVLIALAVIFLLTFLLSRFTAGIGRLPDQQLHRASAAYMLGGALLTIALAVALGAHVYAGVNSWERFLAQMIPWVMIVLGVEMAANFVLDIYRPRTPGAPWRAAFDSRLLGLFSEPGGLAAAVSEAINYQFGFQVSQTWFYRLLQRTFLPLLGVAALALWLLTAIVVVQPYERAIIVQFGRQIDPENPLGPGLHYKAPWPFSLAHKYNTEQLHQFVIGHRTERTERPSKPDEVELWTDREHAGGDHFEFIVRPVRSSRTATDSNRAPVYLLRLRAVVQYRIHPDRLAQYTSAAYARGGERHAETLLKDLAWSELVRFAASADVDSLMGELRESGGELLRDRIRRRADELGLGLDVVYVGLVSVHPQERVAEAFRNVIKAEQERIGSMRKARVTEHRLLSEAAGDRELGIELAAALAERNAIEARRDDAERRLRRMQTADDFEPGDDAREAVRAAVEAAAHADRMAWRRSQIEEDVSLGLGPSRRQLEESREQEAQAVQAAQAARARAKVVLERLEGELQSRGDAAVVRAILDRWQATVALDYWAERIEQLSRELEGKAAVELAQALGRRWQQEMRAAAEVARVRSERDAYRAAPEIYTARAVLSALSEGLRQARKYVLAFDPGPRRVHLRIDAQDVGRPDITQGPTRMPNR